MRSQIVYYDRKMVIPIKSKFEICYYGQLMYIIFDKPYCILHTTKNKPYWVEVPLKDIEDRLPETAFLKCKRSVIINLCYLKSFNRKPPEVEMEDGAKFELSKQNMLDLELMMNKLHDIAPPCPICFPCLDDQCESQALFCKRKNVQHNTEPENK